MKDWIVETRVVSRRVYLVQAEDEKEAIYFSTHNPPEHDEDEYEETMSVIENPNTNLLSQAKGETEVHEERATLCGRNAAAPSPLAPSPAPAPDAGKGGGVVKWPAPKIANPDIANPTGAPYIDSLIHQLLDAQQDINGEANERMSQSLCDASAVIDEVEVALRRLATPTPDPDAARREADGTVSNDEIRLAVVDFMRDMNSPDLPHEACAKLLARRVKKLAEAAAIRARQP